MLFSRHTDYEAGRVAFFREVVLRSDLVAREVATGSAEAGKHHADGVKGTSPLIFNYSG